MFDQLLSPFVYRILIVDGIQEIQRFRWGRTVVHRGEPVTRDGSCVADKVKMIGKKYQLADLPLCEFRKPSRREHRDHRDHFLWVELEGHSHAHNPSSSTIGEQNREVTPGAC